MTPVTTFAHAAMLVEVEVDDETGEVTVTDMQSAYEVGRALNPRLVEQQLRGGAWMGMSHAAWETTEPYYPARDHGPVDFNTYLMPGPGDLAPHHISVLERPAEDGPYGGKGPGEMCANPVLPAVVNAIYDAVGVRIDELAGDAREGAARPARAGRRRSRRKRALAWPSAAPSWGSTGRSRWRARCATRSTSRTKGSRRPPISRWRSASPCCWKARRAWARPRPPRRIASVLGRELVRLQCYEGIDASAAMYDWNFPRQMLAIRQAGEGYVNLYGDEFLIARPMLLALQAPARPRAADRRDRPGRPRVRGVPAGIPVRLHRLDPRTRHDPRLRAARRHPHLEPHARTARGAAPPLRLPLDRLSRPALEAQIVMMRASTVARDTAARVVARWARCAPNRWRSRRAWPRRWNGPRPRRCSTQGGAPWPRAFQRAIGVALKDQDDLAFMAPRLEAILAEAAA